MANTQYNNAFLNNDDLDKQARAINSARKKMAKGVMLDYDTQANETCKGIECLASSQNSKFLPHAFTPSFGFFSAQGDFSNGLPSHFVDSNPLNGNDASDSQSMFSSDNMTSFASQSDGSTLSGDTYSISPISNFSDTSSLSPKIKKQLRLHTKHLQNQHSDDAILGHIKNCEGCKNELISLLQKENKPHIFEAKPMQPDNTLSPDIKDMIILIMIGIFIIILLDLFMRR